MLETKKENEGCPPGRQKRKTCIFKTQKKIFNFFVNVLNFCFQVMRPNEENKCEEKRLIESRLKKQPKENEQICSYHRYNFGISWKPPKVRTSFKKQEIKVFRFIAAIILCSSSSSSIYISTFQRNLYKNVVI